MLQSSLFIEIGGESLGIKNLNKVRYPLATNNLLRILAKVGTGKIIPLCRNQQSRLVLLIAVLV